MQCAGAVIKSAHPRLSCHPRPAHGAFVGKNAKGDGDPKLFRMVDHIPDTNERTAHWESVYELNRVDGVSWYQQEPVVSLELVDIRGVEKDARVVDVGGGASVLVDFLLSRDFTNLTVLDISNSALRVSRERVGPDAHVTWIAHNLLTWEPTHPYDLWHDRAVFHFLPPNEIKIYQDLVRRSVAPGGSVIMAAFAPDGPEWCSGLPVTRYNANQLGEVLGDEFTVVEQRREVHTTPSGDLQPFTWIAASRNLP
jgi:hypothetical protein